MFDRLLLWVSCRFSVVPPAIKTWSVTKTLDSMTDILLLLKIFNAGDTELYV